MAAGAGRVVAGRYRLVQVVGRGGMGAVWQAHDTLLGRDVAVKQIWIPGADDELQDPGDPLVRRALREARAAARLRHPGVIVVHDVVTERGRPWLVMELVDGRSLAQAIAEHGLLTEQQTARVGLRVVEALQAAHRAGIVHRDVKPANIMLEDTGRVVLTDFGIAVIDDATALTATGQMVGSPAYLAPERINGRPAAAASDLWALGVTLYTAVTGRSPFQREDTQATLAAVLTARPVTPAHAGRLWPVIKGLLVKDPDRRLNIEQARSLLATVADPDHGAQPVAAGRRPRWWPGGPPKRPTAGPDGMPGTVVAPPPTLAAPTAHQHQPEPAAAAPVPAPATTLPAAPAAETEAAAARPAAWTRRPAVILAGVLTVVLATISPIAWTWHTGDAQRKAAAVRQKQQEAAAQAALSRKLAAQATALRPTNANLADLLAVYAYHASPTNEAIASLHTTRIHTHTHTDYVYAVAYSPDGRHLATGSRDKAVRVWDLDTGTSRTLTGHTSSVVAVAYSPDGRHLATGGLDETVRVWDLDTGTSRALTGHTGDVYAVAYSPDGRHLATGGLDDTVRVWDLDTGTSRNLTSTDWIWDVAYSPDGRHLASASWDDTVRVWDLDTGTSRALAGHTGSVAAVAYSPDGRHLASGSYDKTVRVWDLDTGTSRTLTGHTSTVDSVAYSPDGGHLASASEDHAVRVWDLDTGTSRTLTGHTSDVYAVAYSPDGQLASGSHDGTIRLWSDGMTPAAMVAHICRTTSGDLTAVERARYLLPADVDTHACPGT